MYILRRRPLGSVTLVFALTLALVAPTFAQQAAAEPEITVREESDRTVREYRVNGRLYAIEIRPASGSAYYLVDHNGDGNFERREEERIAVPGWVHSG